MSSRTGFPKAQVSKSHYFLTLARGENMRCFAVRPWALYATAGLFPLCGLLYFSASMVYIMRDDVVASVYQRQQSMQQAYEDRLADMRAQIDRVSSRQLLDQNSLEGKMHQLISRQAMLETRSAVVTKLTKSITSNPASSKMRAATNAIPLPPRRPAIIGGSRNASLLPAGTTSYANSSILASPASMALGAALGGKPESHPRPRPIEVETTEDGEKSRKTDKLSTLRDPYVQAIAADSRLPVEMRIGALSSSLDLIEAEQLKKVATISSAARTKTQRLRSVIAATGLSADRLRVPAAGRTSSATGGPFVPFKLDPNGPAFERAVLNLQHYAVEADRLQRLVLHIPVTRPVPGHAAITSGFGSRVDPFNGRIASHTGIDFREQQGAPVYSTAAGRIVKAGRNGGYGNMVEIDHGNGLTSRYAHLSVITVSNGQWVKRGAGIGKVGSTGRSTGAHLHYEVRLNDTPLNPMRFIKAGRQL
ncbi:MAG: M23 family metallopeptidase [Beijerinckiaceae bacterium]|jgi:murein DD-endopeptidase MepM/ murein hydrolase activator NlpD|nr:M23 family metallopeptidase [Beijerinckiaceae bacterium]